ncbi:hypothetical protein F5Y17DRAFT_460415, partial [Xylariaceae sp. FL0594]
LSSRYFGSSELDAVFNSTDVDDVTWAELQLRSFLERRTRTGKQKDFLAYCLNNQQGSLIPQTYSGYRTVAGLANKGWISVGKPLVCGAIGVVVNAARDPSVNYVTEHVFEKQTLRNILQYMGKGTLPGGGSISIGAVPQGILDIGGLFFNLWPSTAGVSYGGTPMDTAFGALGHTANDGSPIDAGNLQVVDADINAIKAFVRDGSSL